MQQLEASSRGPMIVLVLGIIVTLAYAIGQLDQASRTTLVLVFPILPGIVALSATCLGIMAVQRAGVRRTDRQSIVWFGFMLGMIMFLLGEATSSAYPLVLNQPLPAVSIADLFWLSGYVVFLIALLGQALPFRESFSRKLIFLVFLVVLASIVATVFLLQQEMAPARTLEWAVDLAYPVFDIILLSIGIPLTFLFRGGLYWRPFMFLVSGAILSLIGGLLSIWIFLITNVTYVPGNPIDLMYVWAYLSVGLGFHLRRMQVAKGHL